MRHVLFLVALVLATFGCAEAEPETDVNRTGGVAEVGGGNPFDSVNPGVVEDPANAGKADTARYEVPTELPTLEEPYIVVSLDGLTIELIDEATGFHKVYPVGVGARGRDSGKSFTPTGSFRLGNDTSSGWWWYERRYNPSYFDGLPFLRITAKNSRGHNTYGFHGPITDELIRGFVSHGCMRMRPDDIIELFYIMMPHPGASVVIQEQPRYDEDGEKVDVTPDELDPVRIWRESRNECAEDGLFDGAELQEGSHSLTVCDGQDDMTVPVGAGDKVNVTVSAKTPLDLFLALGDADATATAVPDAEGYFHTTASLRVGESGLVKVAVTGEATGYELVLAVERFDP